MLDHAAARRLSNVEPLTPHFGVAVSGIDVRALASAEDVSELERLLADEQVVVFKDQRLAPDDLVAFTSRFGTPDPHVLAQFSLPGYRDIYVISNIVEDGKPIGNRQEGFGWHTDLSYRERPAGYTILYGLEVPRAGGETMFASARCVYEAMGEEEKARLRPLQVWWDYAKIYALRTNVPPFTPELRAQTPPVTQPLVRVHPLTGRESLYVSGDGCAGIVGMPEDEGIRLVRELLNRTIGSEYVYAHRWSPGDLVIWDNRGLVHTATEYDMDKERRLVYRMSVRGERPIPAAV